MTETNQEKRAKIIAKIRALLQMTVANGCSEEEALRAAELANQWMEKHDLTYTDVETEVRSEKYGNRARPFAGGSPRRRSFHPVIAITWHIANYWDCKAWWRGADLIYFGSETDTEMAHAMTDLIRIAMDGEWTRYSRIRTKGNIHGRTARASFLVGMRRRIAGRLDEIKEQRTKAATKPASSPNSSAIDALPVGRSLVVVRTEVVAQKWEKYEEDAGIKLKTHKFNNVRSDADAYRAGVAAGDRVDLSGSKLSAQKTIAAA